MKITGTKELFKAFGIIIIIGMNSSVRRKTILKKMWFFFPVIKG